MLKIIAMISYINHSKFVAVVKLFLLMLCIGLSCVVEFLFYPCSDQPRSVIVLSVLASFVWLSVLPTHLHIIILI